FSSQNVTVTNPTSFAFNYLGSASLLPSTNYWVVLSAPASEAFGWYVSNAFPTQQNASGYAFTAGKSSSNSGGSWSDNPFAGFGAVSITAVPEPSSIVLAGLGVLAVGYQLRRRMKRA
ncbi:MAG: PEP-CTERM sorting domain-containing protein, partial [Planctomycetota bacterium]